MFCLLLLYCAVLVVGYVCVEGGGRLGSGGGGAASANAKGASISFDPFVVTTTTTTTSSSSSSSAFQRAPIGDASRIGLPDAAPQRPWLNPCAGWSQSSKVSCML